MFKNYLAITVRNLLKHKGYTLVNILGLAVGMACCILILLYVQDELSYDRYHDNAHRIYRVVDGADTKTPPLLAPVMQQEFPEVLDFARIRSPYGVWMMAYGDKIFYERRVFWADASFFDFFSWRLLAGDSKTALAEPFGVVISEATAQKYFGREDPMGKIIHADQGFADLKVTGVMQSTPPNSHFKSDFLVSNVTQESVYDAWRLTNWFDPEYHTYILLPEDYQVAELTRKLPVLNDKYVTPQFRQYGLKLDQLHLQPLTDIHLRSHFENELEDNSDIVYIYILSAVALLVLLIAAINYMNLATARSAGRAREVGMRKVVGAHRRQLIVQFLGESVFISLLALLLALLLLQIILPAFAALSGKTLTVVDFDRPGLLPALLGFAVLVGLFAGSYPALYLSALPPVAVLKGAGMMRSSRAVLRKGLVLVQFAVSIMLLIGSGVLYDQLSYISNRRLGFAKDQVVILNCHF